MLDALFRPNAIAVIGASANPHAIGNIVLRNVVQNNFRGHVYPINPKGGVLQGLPVYPSICDVPTQVDLVNISVHRDHLIGILHQCASKGVKFAIIHSAGFKEVGAEGAQRERQLLDAAREAGIRIVGPNCQGVQNADPHVSLYANFTFTPMTEGNVAIVAQGGGMGELLQLHLHHAGVGYRMYASFGNEADVGMSEFLEYYGKDDATKLIVLHAETFKDPDRLQHVVALVTKKKPIFALKTARTDQGACAASAHTGTLAEASHDTSALLARAGAVCFRDSSEMIQAATAMALLTQRTTSAKPKGKRLAIVTNSGGPAVQAVDVALEQGLQLAAWSDASRARLLRTALAEASLANPLDLVATAGPEQYFEAIDTVLHDPGVDVAMVFFVTAHFVDHQAITNSIIRASNNSEKPLLAVVCSPDRNGPVQARLRQAGIAVYEFVEHAVKSIAAVCQVP